MEAKVEKRAMDLASLRYKLRAREYVSKRDLGACRLFDLANATLLRLGVGLST